MKCLYVLFDADCELCVRCRNWLMQQPAFVPLVFIAFQSDEAQRRFPGIDGLKPEEQLLVISDEGAVYRGATCMDHVSLGARELSRTRATASASSFTAACKTRLRIALSKPLLPIRCVVPPGTTQRGAEGCCPF